MKIPNVFIPSFDLVFPFLQLFSTHSKTIEMKNVVCLTFIVSAVL